MTALIIATSPIAGQKPGTSGLRKKTPVFMGPHYLENFTQSIFDAIGGAAGKTFVLGGDGRYFNDSAAQIILKMAAANGAAKVIVGQHAVLSTPAASHLIRLNKTDGGIIMSASHNPGGPEEDFGVKFNMANGGPAPEAVTEAMYQRTTELTEYRISDAPDIDLGRIGATTLDGMAVEVVDSVTDYAALMETLFDFPAIRAMFAGGFTMRFDAMCAVTGPYATEILENRLGAAKGTVTHGTPLPDFGGMHAIAADGRHGLDEGQHFGARLHQLVADDESDIAGPQHDKPFSGQDPVHVDHRLDRSGAHDPRQGRTGKGDGVFRGPGRQNDPAGFDRNLAAVFQDRHLVLE